MPEENDKTPMDEFVDEGSHTDSDAAPEDGHSDDVTPKDGDADKGEGDKGDDDQAPDERTPADGDDTAKDGDQEADAERDKIINEELGAPAEDEADPVWFKRYNDVRSHATGLETDAKRQAEFLKDQGIEIISTKDGLALAPTEGYISDLKPEDIGVGEIWNSLSKAEKDQFETSPEDACNIVASKLAVNMLSKQPPVTATQEDKMLSDAEVGVVWGDFVNAKHASGRPMFPDAGKTNIQEYMKRAIMSTTRGMDKLRDHADRDPDMNHILLELSFFRTFKALHASGALKADAKAVASEKKKKNNNEAIKGEGTNINAGGKSGKKGETMLDFVVGSDGENSGDFM